MPSTIVQLHNTADLHFVSHHTEDPHPQKSPVLPWTGTHHFRAINALPVRWHESINFIKLYPTNSTALSQAFEYFPFLEMSIIIHLHIHTWFITRNFDVHDFLILRVICARFSPFQCSQFAYFIYVYIAGDFFYYYYFIIRFWHVFSCAVDLWRSVW